MKKIVSVFFLLVAITAQAKYIRFTVDMTDQLVSANGVHLTGDFQALLGLDGGDWQSNTLLLEQQADTNLYSVVLNLPAFRKYEYKYVNGDQFYEVEFVPWEARVGYDFNDNRWLYLDSLSNDTTYIGALQFGGHAPAGLSMMRFLVDMQYESGIANEGVHLVADFQDMDATATYMYSFVPGIFEVIAYAPAGTYSYAFVNGEDMSAIESIPLECANTDGYRTIYLTDHIALPAVCFSSCSACVASNVNEHVHTMLIFPNPSDGYTSFSFPDGNVKTVEVVDALGRSCDAWNIQGMRQFAVDMRNYSSGVYYARVLTMHDKLEIITLVKQ